MTVSTVKLGRYLRTLTLSAQRHSAWCPPWIRSAAKHLLGRTGQGKYHEIEDWSAPLIARGPTTVSAKKPQVRPSESRINVQTVERPHRSHKSTGANGGRLRCLIVTRVLDAGGVDEFVSFLARQLPHFGFDATVMCEVLSNGERSRIGHLASELRKEGIDVVEARPEDGPRWLANHRPDVISAHDPPDWILEASTYCKSRLLRLHGVPTPIGTDWKREPMRSRYINSIVAVSELVRRQYLQGNSQFDVERIITIPNAFNEAHRPIVDRSEARLWLGLQDEFLFVSLGRYVLQKNGYGLVAAFAEVARKYPEAHLLLAGRVDDCIYAEQIRRLRNALPERTQIHLRQNQPNPSALLAAADCFVLNSFFEGWPLASMEALSAGLPVIISDVGGAREQVGDDGSRGYVVPNPAGDTTWVSWETAGRLRFKTQHNKNALVDAMTSVVRDREHWARVRTKLATASKYRFSARTCAEQHANILRASAKSLWPLRAVPLRRTI